MLSKKLVPMVFGQGIKTKIDAKSQMLGTFRKAKNVVFETINAFKKRNGYTALLLKTLDESVISSVESIATLNNELLAFANKHLYGYSPSINRVLDRGPIYSVVPSTTSILNNSNNHDFVDYIAVENFGIYVYHNDTQDTIHYSVVDLQSNVFLASNVLVGTGQICRVAAINNTVHFIYGNGSNLLDRRINVFQPATLSSPLTVANNLATSTPLVDAVGTSSKLIIAYKSSDAAARIKLISIESDNSVGGGVGITSSPVATSLSLEISASNQLYVAYSSSTAVFFTVVNFLLNTVLVGPVTIETISDVVAIDIQPDTATNIVLVYEVSAAATYNHYLKRNTVSNTGSVGTAAVFKRGVGLASKGFKVDSAQYTVAMYGSTFQSTIFVLDSSANIVTKLLPNAASSLLNLGILGRNSTSGTTATIASLVKTRINSDNGTFFSVLGVNSTQLEFNPSQKHSTAPFAKNLHIGGGMLHVYDGAQVVEHGFHVDPEAPAAGTTHATGGFIGNGTYAFVAVYRWTDNAGQDQYSAPSLATEVVVGSGGPTHSIDITVPTLRLTAKQNVVIELYRTEDSGTLYYLEASIANNPAVDTVSFTATLADSTLISRQLLYTTGGILENTATASVAVMGVHTAANRLVIVGENRNQIQYSKIREDGKPVEFNGNLLKDVDPIGGKITAVASMDEKLVIFEENAIFYISGSGPNNAGQQDSYTEPERVSIDVGCIDARSVVLMPLGLMFKSKKGIYLLNRALGTEYIGADAEAYNGLTITSAKLVPDENQVRFGTSDGETIVYNYFTAQWSTYNNHVSVSAEIVNNVYNYVRNDGQVFQQDSSFSDNSSAISMDVETGWMTFGSLQGFQRVYKMMFLGTYKSEHKLRVQVAYDFNDAWVQDVVIDPLTFLDPSVYGLDSPYGSGSPYGGTGTVYQARIDFQRQKCQAIKVRITDILSDSGEGLEISGITLQVGVKAGTNKVSASKQFGTS